MNTFRCFVLASALAALAPMRAEAAEGDQLLATPEKPAVVTVARPAATESKTRGNPAIHVQVTGYQPPAGGGSVLIDVKAEQPGGAERDIGKFGLSLDRPFTASESSRAQTFRLRLPPDLAGTEPLRLKVYVVPSRGDAREARVEIGKAEIK
jgi:hypothetical protein